MYYCVPRGYRRRVSFTNSFVTINRRNLITVVYNGNIDELMNRRNVFLPSQNAHHTAKSHNNRRTVVTRPVDNYEMSAVYKFINENVRTVVWFAYFVPPRRNIYFEFSNLF